MKSLAQHIQFVEQSIQTYPLPSEPATLYEPIRYFMQLGGKRMRPVLTLMSGELFNVSDKEAIQAAMAIEFFHNFSLVHDDIMDQAPLRRGKQTVHTKWDLNTGILAGDVLLIEGYKCLANYADERLPELLRRYNETAEEVYQGQTMDTDFEKLSTVSVEEYIEMIRLKTAVLLGCALEFGAILAKKDDATRKLLYTFGESLGLAFQIQDDVLDLYADPEKFGKQVGGDILSNKKTLLLLTAEQLAKQSNRTEAFEALLNSSADEQKVETARVLFKELGAKTAVEQELERYYQKALQQLNDLNLAPALKEPLFELAAYLIQREV